MAMRFRFDRWLMEKPLRSTVLHLCRWGVTPNAVTAAGLGIGMAIPFLHQARLFAWVASGLVVRQLLDCLDGEIARCSRRESRAGAILDSVSDGVFFFDLIWLAAARVVTGWLALLALTTGTITALAAVHVSRCGVSALTDHSIKTYDTTSLYRKSFAFLITNSMLIIPALAGLFLAFPR